MAVTDWFLSAAERGNPATRLDSRHRGRYPLDVRQSGRAARPWRDVLRGVVALPRAGARRRPRAVHRLARRSRSASRRVGCRVSPRPVRGSCARRDREGADLAVAPGPAVVQRAAEPPSRRAHRSGRRRMPARHARASRRFASPEVRRASGTPAGPSSTSRSSAGSICATAGATTPTTGATRRSNRWRRCTGTDRRGTTSSWRCRDPRWGTSRQPSVSAGRIRLR